MNESMKAARGDRDLLERLKNVREATASEKREQRISFVIGVLGSDNTLTREEVRKIVEAA